MIFGVVAALAVIAVAVCSRWSTASRTLGRVSRRRVERDTMADRDRTRRCSGRLRLVVAIGVLIVVAGGCSSGGDDTAEPTPEATSVDESEPVAAAPAHEATLADESESVAAEPEPPSTPEQPDTLTEPCSTVVEVSLNQIEASLEGNPVPIITGAQTATFKVNGDEVRVIVVALGGPGFDDPDFPVAKAVFWVDPAGTVYAENSFARGSAFEYLELDDEWGERIAYVESCLG